MDELITQFVGITDSTPDKARQYLNISENNLEQAIELFFNTGGVDLIENSDTASTTRAPPAETTAPEVIDLDSDDDGISTPKTKPAISTEAIFESDEAMARRLQEEMYGSGGAGARVDADGYRAPIASKRETLVGPDSYDLGDREDLQAAMAEQLFRRSQMSIPAPYQPRTGLRNAGRAQPGIFNQQESSRSIWNDDSSDSSPTNFQDHLARSTDGASRTSNTHTVLAQMYRPPFELISPLTWEDAREEGKAESKWLLVNIQDPSIFDCQILNRDLWKHEGIRETIKENFIFMQYNKDDPRGSQYIQYYFPHHDSGDSYPHIAIVDPRTGEQVKTWSGPPVPKASEFLMQLHEFLDRYSLDAAAKNPIAKRKPEKRKGVDTMTEDEQLQMAMQASLANEAGASAGGLLPSPRDDDPDALTRSISDLQEEDQHPPNSTNGKDDGITEVEPTPPSSPFDLISSDLPHSEPASSAPETTRIQFRHPTGRIVRRFALSDTVRRLYEWLKAEPLEGSQGQQFELVAMGKNLMESLEQSIADAGLRNGTVMVEFVG